MAQQYDGSIRIDTRINQTGFNKGIAGIQGSVNRLGSSLKSLAATVGLAFGVAQIVKFGKEAISLASDLNEVQNVVETAFGSMSTQVDAWAKNSIKQFGMSELAAKQMASTYMAMSVGSGLQGQGAADMAMKTAERAADISSFYNKSLEESDTMLKSIWTGETESLKQIGVVMTQTNLDAFALANGFGKTTSEMTQSEQIMLRYQYVMEQTRLAAGDFIKTQDSWANQTRILSEQWKQFLSIMGEALIQILTPALQFLNQFMSVLIGWAQTFSAVVSALFGKKVDTAANAMSGAASSANSLAGSTAGAAAAQDDLASSTAAANKELQKQTASFDEMNVLQSKTSSTGGSGGGSGSSSAGGMGVPDLSGITSVQDQVENSMSEFENLIKSKDWAGLGAYIADGLNRGLQQVYEIISWDNVRPKVEPFITGFTGTFNSLVSHIDWDLMGRTVGAGINTIVGTLVLLISGIDWVNIGASFADGLNGMFAEVDWNNIGVLLGQRLMIAWNVFYGFVTNLNWGQVGYAIGTGINGAIANIDLAQVASSLAAFAIGILTALTIAIQTTDWTAIGQQIANALASVDWVGIGSGLFNAGLTLLGGLLEAFTQLPGPVQIAAGVVGGFYTVAKGKELFDTLSTKYTELKDFFDKSSKFITDTAIPKIKEGFDKFKTFIVDTAVPKITGAFSTFKDFIVTTVIPKMTTSISGFFTFLAANPVILIIAAITAAVIALVALIATKGDEIQAMLKKVNDFLQNIFAKDWTKVFGPVLGDVLNAFMRNVKNIWDSIKKVFDGVIDFIRGVFTGDWKRAWNGVKEIFGGIFDGLTALAKAPLNGIIGLLNAAISGINELIKGFNSIGFDLPSWLGGGSWHPSIPTIPKIPYLAQGAVIPPNQQFLAVLGDQKKGTNVEAPLDTIKQALSEVMVQQSAGISGPVTFVLKVGETTLGRATLKSLQNIARQNGGLALDLR